MEYVYSVLLLHTLGKEITEENVEKIVAVAGATPDSAKIKALMSSLEGINIDEAIKSTAFAAAVPAAPAAASQPPKEEKKKEEKKEEEEAMAGLGALFG